MLIQNLQPVKTQLEIIENKIDQLLLSPSPGLNFIPLTLSPTYSTSSNINPGNLHLITDGDESTSCDQFEAGGSAWIYADLLMNPGVSIPNYNLISGKFGYATNYPPNRPGIQIAVNNGGVFLPIWGGFGDIISTGNPENNIQTFSVICPNSWSQLRIRIWDLGAYGTRCKVYSLKIFEVN